MVHLCFHNFFRGNFILVFHLFIISAYGQVTFTDVTASSGSQLGEGTARGMAWGDFNKDNFIDLFLPTAGNVPNKLYRNNGDGTFTEISAAVNLNDLANTITCSWGDFDNDGDIDLVTTATAAATRLWRNNRDSSGVDSSFTSIETTAGIVQSGGQMPAWADYDNDGFLDFYSPMSNSATLPDVLYRNNGNATFTNTSTTAGVNNQVAGPLEQAIHWGDFNKDGYPDLFVGSIQTTGSSFFYENNGNGTFTEKGAVYGINLSGRGAQWIDFNNDGHWDFSFAPYLGATAVTPIRLYKNNGSNVFQEVAVASGITDNLISWGVTWADYDNNGYEDLFVTTSGQSTLCQLYQNNGNGTFTNATAASGLSSLVQLHAAWGDYNNDGWMDLYSGGSATNGNHLFKNNGEPGKHWLQFNLRGTVSNGAGVGARVVVKSGTLNMMREVNTGVGYRSQNQMRVHFGLNTNTSADSIIVYWPGGLIDRWANIPADQYMTLIEGSTIPVELVSFTAATEGNSVVLNWQTATETNNAGFRLLRKSETSIWENISYIEGNGTITEPQYYSYTDSNLKFGKYFYKLVQVDFDETSVESPVISADINSITGYSLEQNYPNPFNPSTKIVFSIPVKSHVTISLFDILGCEIAIIADAEFNAGYNEVIFSPSGSLTNGIYVYQLRSESYSAFRKMVYLK
jgi:hypothetical protein